jgi:hypothetical protein
MSAVSTVAATGPTTTKADNPALPTMIVATRAGRVSGAQAAAMRSSSAERPAGSR